MRLSDNARGALYMSISMASFTCGDAAMKLALQHIPQYQAITIRGVMATLWLTRVINRPAPFVAGKPA